MRHFGYDSPKQEKKKATQVQRFSEFDSAAIGNVSKSSRCSRCLELEFTKFQKSSTAVYSCLRGNSVEHGRQILHGIKGVFLLSIF